MTEKIAENVLLSGGVAKGLFKCALAEGFIELAKPLTDSEKDQIKNFETGINRSRSSHNALLLGLLANRIYLDEPSMGGLTIFKNLNDDDEDSWQENRSVVSGISSSLSGTVEFTDPTSSYYMPTLHELPDGSPLSQGYHTVARELASTCNLLEPLIWARSRKNQALRPLERKYFRELFDRALLDERFQNVFFAKIGEELDDDEGAKFIAETYPEYDPVEYWRFMYLLKMQASMVLSKVREAERVNAKLPLVGWIENQVQFNRQDAPLTSDVSYEAIASIKVVLREFRYFPALNSFADLLRVREHPEFVRFRTFLDMWTRAFSDGDAETEASLRSELRSANRSLNKSVRCKDIGGYLTYIGLPMIALDAMVGPFFGTPVTIGGFGLQSYADWKNRKSRWVLVGR